MSGGFIPFPSAWHCIKAASARLQLPRAGTEPQTSQSIPTALLKVFSSSVLEPLGFGWVRDVEIRKES